MSREGIKAHSQSAAECKEKHEGARERTKRRRKRKSWRTTIIEEEAKAKKRRRRRVRRTKARIRSQTESEEVGRNKARRRMLPKVAQFDPLRHTRKRYKFARLYFIAGLFERQRRRFEKFHGKHHLFCISLEVLPRTRTTKSSTTTTI